MQGRPRCGSAALVRAPLSIYRDYLERMASVWGEEISEEELNDPRACTLLPLDGLYFDRRIAGEADDFPDRFGHADLFRC